MAKRRVHSSIDKLPSSLKEALTRMLVDDFWPDDFVGVKDGKPKYDDLVAYCRQKGHTISESAMGRFGARMRTLATMKSAGVIVRDVMKDLNNENASATQKAVAEMITAQTIHFVANKDNLKAKEIKEVSQAMRDCAQISIKADTYIRDQLKVKAKAADKAITKIAGKKKIDPETLKAIREQVYGIV